MPVIFHPCGPRDEGASRRRTWVFWGLVALCVSCQAPQSPPALSGAPWFPAEPPGSPPSKAAPFAAPEASADSAEQPACEDPPPPWPRCGSELLRTQVPLEFNPRYLPPAHIRTELDSVARAMHDDPSWQMLRIEVYTRENPGAAGAARARALRDTQQRAEAIFSYLYHHRKVSAERLDAVGYGYSAQVAEATRDVSVRYPVLLRLVHRAESAE